MPIEIEKNIERLAAGGHASLLNDADALINLQHALKPVYRANGTWLMNDTTLYVVRKLKDGDGRYIWMPGLMEGSPDMLLGRPVEINEDMSDIRQDAYPIVFDDFKRAYTIVDHVSGIRLLRDPFTKKGWVNFYVTKRLTGGVSKFSPLKVLQGGVQGPSILANPQVDNPVSSGRSTPRKPACIASRFTGRLSG